MLFAITRICNIRIKWRGWQMKLSRQEKIWQLWMQHTLGMFHIGKQLFTVVCTTKNIYFLLGMDDRVGKLSRWKHVVLIEIKDAASKKLGCLSTEDQWVPSEVAMILLQSISGEEKILKVGKRAVEMNLEYCNTNSFYPRTSEMWNKLPREYFQATNCDIMYSWVQSLIIGFDPEVR